MEDDDTPENVIDPAKPLYQRHKSEREVEPFGGMYRRSTEVLAIADARRLETAKMPLPTVHIGGQEQTMDYRTADFQRFEQHIRGRGYIMPLYVECLFPEYALELERHRVRVTASERLAIRRERYLGENHEPPLGKMRADPSLHALRPANVDLPDWKRTESAPAEIESDSVIQGRDCASSPMDFLEKDDGREK